MIDSLFGSKTRVKLLHLFLNNPGKSFYVREMSRLIGEQINSVRRELSNLSEVGLVTSSVSESDNKRFYELNQTYEFYAPFRAIFAGKKLADRQTTTSTKKINKSLSPGGVEFLKGLSGVRVAIVAGVLVEGSASPVDLLLVGNIPKQKIETAVEAVQNTVGRDVNYSRMDFDEFYYRLSIRDRFLSEILNNKHEVLVDTDESLKGY